MKQIRSTPLSAVDASINQVSAVIDSNQLFAGSLQALIVGTATGTLKIQVSNQYEPLSEPQVYVPTEWTDLNIVNVYVVGGSNVLVTKFDLCYRWIRLVYTAISGTGALTAYFFAQGV